MTHSRSIVATAVTLALLGAGASGVAAAEIAITKGDCKTGVQLVARDAPLHEVLERLSKTLSFQLQLEGPADTPVNVSTSAPAPALIASIAAQERVMISQAPDPKCPGQARVARVWVLPKGTEVVAKPVAKFVPQTRVGTPEDLRRAGEESKKLKEAYEDYVRRNGKPPPGEEEDAAKP